MSRILRSLLLSLVLVASLAGAAHVAAQDGDTGTVRVSKYFCTYLDQTLQLEAIDADECSPGAATFTFYLIGDGTADYEQLVLDASGDGSIVLPVGSYEMIEEGSQATFALSVVAGQTTRMLIGNPSGEPAPAPEPATGTVILQHYLCSYLDETLLVEALDLEECAPAATTFTFYLYGDGTGAFQQAAVGANGQGSIELAAGAYEAVEEGSQAHFDVNVLGGEDVVLLVAGPRPASPAPTPVPTQAPAPAPAKPATSTKTPVKLPNTGAGVEDSSSAAFVIAAAGAVVAAGAGFALRSRASAL